MREMQGKQWSELWLAYQAREGMGNEVYFKNLFVQGFSQENPIVKNLLEELKRGAEGMLGISPAVTGTQGTESVSAGAQGTGAATACTEGTESVTACGKGAASVSEQTGENSPRESGLLLKRSEDAQIKEEGFRIKEDGGVLSVEAKDEKGLLYGGFQVLRMVSMERGLKGTDLLVNPDNPLRMYNHWDNMDGSIERGYSGNSFFFEKNQVVVNERTVDYARLMASIGINAVVINNVNVRNEATWLITDRHFEKVAQMAEIFAGYGIRFFLSLNYAAVMELGGLDSADPLKPEVIAWWQGKMKEVFAAIPNLGGFLVKADSEGRPGPFTYGRTQADGANMLADIVKPYGAIIIWRCFVYNCTQDWRDYKTDRARAGYDNFIQMDGDYHENVILQIKNGPMDFQIREPVSPLLGGLKKTNQMLEVQVAQEYTGHQIDVCYLIPMYKEVLDFKTYCADEKDLVADVISGRTMGNKNTGIAAVCNTGNNENWTGNDLAAANLYGFGRLAFQTDLSAEEILEEWIRMSFSNDASVVETIQKILLPSRATYEKYTSPLGIGWMVTPATHYGCSVDGYEYSRWGTYHRADHLGIGVDRSDKGTGYAMQYYEPNASLYNQMETCPEELLLFFHHVPYTYRLKSGKTLIQHIYDSHFEGVEEVEVMIAEWESLQGKVSPEVYDRVRGRFDRQLFNAKEWRDQVNSYFYRKSGIADEKGRAIY